MHLLHIWLLPSVRGIAPGDEQKLIERKQRHGCLLASIAVGIDTDER